MSHKDTILLELLLVPDIVSEMCTVLEMFVKAAVVVLAKPPNISSWDKFVQAKVVDLVRGYQYW